MCKIQNTTFGIKRLDFSRRGKMAVHLTDDREMIVPLSFFRDIKRLPMRQCQDWMILDD